MRRVEEFRLMSHSQGHIVLLAPMTGPVVPLANVPDPVFSGGMFGDGIGVDPLEGKLVAPCDGVVTHLARTGHALTLATAEGAEILLHIGIDTVELNGRGFTPKVAQGAQVRTGDLLIEFDQDLVACNASEPGVGDRDCQLGRVRDRRAR
jgi:glucose-specific phosphotransferase system IIA component